MSRKWSLLFYFLELCWCIWLFNWVCEELKKDATWYNFAAAVVALGLLVWWVWTIYRVIKPKPKVLAFELEGDIDGGFFVSLNGRTKVGPFTYRHEAFNWITEETKKEMRR